MEEVEALVRSAPRSARRDAPSERLSYREAFEPRARPRSASARALRSWQAAGAARRDERARRALAIATAWLELLMGSARRPAARRATPSPSCTATPPARRRSRGSTRTIRARALRFELYCDGHRARQRLSRARRCRRAARALRARQSERRRARGLPRGAARRAAAGSARGGTARLRRRGARLRPRAAHARQRGPADRGGIGVPHRARLKCARGAPTLWRPNTRAAVMHDHEPQPLRVHATSLPATGTSPQSCRHCSPASTDLIANAANTAALLFAALPEVNWAGFYFLSNGELVVGPFQGKPACVRIALGRGVCGTAAAERRTLVVADVQDFPGHIACDAASRAEIVVPLLRGGDALRRARYRQPAPRALRCRGRRRSRGARRAVRGGERARVHARRMRAPRSRRADWLPARRPSPSGGCSRSTCIRCATCRRCR